MELRHLRYFLAVADEAHMTRAAARLGIAQPPLSQQIRALEQQLGVTLLRRHPKGVALTDAGKLFVADARSILQDVAAMERRMAGAASGHEGVLAVGFTSSAALHRFTPAALRSCRNQYPGIALDIRESNAAEITEAVADGRLHCGLLRVPVARPPGLKFETLLHEPAVAALPLDHPLPRRSGKGRVPDLRLSDLRDDGWILVRRPDAPGLYANLLTLCEKQGFKPRVVAEVDRMMTNLNLVAAGAGVSVVPASMQGLHADAVRYCPLASRSRLDAPLTLVYREGDDTGTTRTFIALLRQLAAQAPTAR